MKRSIVAIFLLLYCFCSSVSGQSPAHHSDTVRAASSVRFNLRYKSDYYYMGRADSARTPYLIPSVGYYHKSGLSVYGSMAYLATSSESRVDLYTLAAGYDYFGEKFATGISVSEYFFDDESYAVQAEMSTYVSAYAGYDLGVVMVFVDGSIGVSDNTDVFLGAEVSHTFYTMNDKLLITPAIYSNAGTQHYYSEYYRYRSETTGERKGKGKGPGGSSQPAVGTLEIRDAEKFQVLDYEVSLQLSYRLSQWRFMTSVTVLFPVNPSTVVTTEGTYTEQLDTGVLWTAGIRYAIRLTGR